MADADKLLKLIVDLELVGKEDMQAATDLLNQQKKSVKELADEEVAASQKTIAAKNQEREVLEQIKAQRASASAAGRDTSKFDDAIKRLNHSLEEGGHHFNSARLNSELFRISMMSLGAYMPGLETAFYAAFSAGQASFLGIMGALLAFENEMKSLSDTAAIQEVAFKGDADAIAAVESATQKADIAARLYIEDLVRQNAAGASAADIAARTVTNYKNLASAQEELDQAQKSVGAASIEARERKGVISHQQALEEKYRLDVSYAQRKIQLEAWTNQQEEAAKRQQLQTEQQQLKASLEDQKTDQATAKKAEQEKARHDARTQTAKDNLASAQKTLDELAKSHGAIIKGQIDDDNVQKLTDYYEKYVGNSKNVSLPDQFLKLQQAMKSVTNKASWDFGLTQLLDREIGSQNIPALAKYEGAHQQLSGARNELTALGKTQFDVDLNAQRASKQLSATDDAVRSLQASVNKLANELPKLVADHAAKVSNDTTAANLNLTAEAVKNGLQPPSNPLAVPPRATATASWPGQPTGTYREPPPADPQAIEKQARGNFGLLEDYANVVHGGGQLDERQTQVLRGMVSALNGHTANNKELQAALDAVLGSNKMRDQILEKFQSALTQQSVQISRLQGGQ